MKIRWLAGLISLTVWVSGSATYAEPAQKFSVPAALSGAELEQAQAERRALFAEMFANPSRLDVSLRYTQLSIECGDLEAAISTLERLQIFSPGVRDLQLTLGILYARLGATALARDYFDQAASAPAGDDAVSLAAKSYLSGARDPLQDAQP